jgi:hypothetical protein
LRPKALPTPLPLDILRLTAELFSGRLTAMSCPPGRRLRGKAPRQRAERMADNRQPDKPARP